MKEIVRARIDKLDAPVCELGESPMWHSARGEAFWVDITGNAILLYDWKRGVTSRYPGSNLISRLWEDAGTKDRLVVGAQGGVGTYDLLSQRFSVTTDFGKDWSYLRCNDGAADCLGNLWIGTTHVNHVPGGGDLYCVSEGWRIEKKIPRVSISNGLCWSADNRTMYYIDSQTGTIRAYQVDVSSRKLTNKRTLVEIPNSHGLPDGMAMDRAGIIWVALWGGAGVGGYDSHSGEMICWISIPALQVTSCAFVGPGRDYLLVTTARKGLTEQDLKLYPESGSTFIVRMDEPGLDAFPCTLATG